MSETNPLWGAPQIQGELLKLGLDISQATVAKYMVRLTNTVANLAHIPDESSPATRSGGFWSSQGLVETFRRGL
jgi:hypothetical protein